MTLSEAIRLGAMLKPQYRGAGLYGDGGSCALGAAIDACGCARNHEALERRFPILSLTRRSPCVVGERYIYMCIWDMNDVLGWTREQIADWVESVENEIAARDTQPEAQAVATTVNAVAEAQKSATPVHVRV